MSVSVITMAVLGVVALATSMVSAILGMGGGITLLAVMLCFMSHAEAIPTHAAVQIASNGTRVFAFRKHIDVKALTRFAIGVIPGGAIGAFLLWWLGQPESSEPYLKTLIGAFILASTFIPKPKAGHEHRSHWWDFPLMGLAAGTAALTVGAVGPLIAPLFARLNFVKERLIATKATCQLLTHFMKIPAFLLLRDLELSRLGILASIMILTVIPGTLIGKRILKGVSDRYFRIGYRVALTLAGTKVLLIDGVMQWSVWTNP